LSLDHRCLSWPRLKSDGTLPPLFFLRSRSILRAVTAWLGSTRPRSRARARERIECKALQAHTQKQHIRTASPWNGTQSIGSAVVGTYPHFKQETRREAPPAARSDNEELLRRVQEEKRRLQEDRRYEEEQRSQEQWRRQEQQRADEEMKQKIVQANARLWVLEPIVTGKRGWRQTWHDDATVRTSGSKRRNSNAVNNRGKQRSSELC
jgi:hypothetical protein